MNRIDLEMSYEKASSLLELAKRYRYPLDAIARQQAHCDKLKDQMRGGFGFTVNGVEFIIDQFQDGWGWTTKRDESQGCFESPWEAQQDGLRYASEQAKAPEEPEDDNYQAEVAASWNRRDYV